LPKIVRKPDCAGDRVWDAPAAEELIAPISFSYDQITRLRFLFIERPCYVLGYRTGGQAVRQFLMEEITMKVWSKPAVREQEVGLEVTSYMPAEIDII
jgi:coenzyme PQQ precursor peptide PqqA